MREVYIVGAVRSPIGRRKGGLSGLHPADLLGVVQRAAVERSGVDPGAVGQIIGGCVSIIGSERSRCFRASLPSASSISSRSIVSIIRITRERPSWLPSNRS